MNGFRRLKPGGNPDDGLASPGEAEGFVAILLGANAAETWFSSDRVGLFGSFAPVPFLLRIIINAS